MTDEELPALFISDEGEVKELPEFAGKDKVMFQRMEPPDKFPISQEDASKQVEYKREVWRSVTMLSEVSQKAILSLWRGQAEARLLALDWYHHASYGPQSQIYSDKLEDLLKRSAAVERRVDEEMGKR